MDSFGNSNQQKSDPTVYSGNPFSGGNPLNPSITNYLSFLKSILSPTSPNKEGSAAPTPLGPKKWEGPNGMQISKAGSPSPALPQKIQVVPSYNPAAPPPSSQQKQGTPYDPYAAAAQMNKNTMNGSGTWSNYVNQGGYSFGGATDTSGTSNAASGTSTTPSMGWSESLELGDVAF